MKKKKISKKSPARTLSAIGEPSTRFCLLTVFFAAVLARVAFNFIFLGRYGLHAMGNPETWFYYGVAEGHFHLNLLDPTYWHFRLLGLFLRGDALLLGVIGSAVVLTSLTSVLLFLIVRETHNRMTALGAGLIYSFLGNPFELSVASFTHDFFQVPIMLVSWLLLLKIFQKKGFPQVFLSLLLIMLFIPGFAVGPLAVATVGVVAFFLARKLIGAVAPRAELTPLQEELVFVALLIFVTALFRWVYYPRLWESLSFFAQRLRGLNISLQRQAGSADLMSISPAGYWVQYGFLLFFLPFGFLVCFQRRDTLAMANFFVSLMAGLIALRGTRSMDLSVAIFTGAALANWRKPWVLPAAVLMIFGLPYVIVSKFFPGHDVIYSAGAVSLLLVLLLVPKERYRYLPLTAACLFAIGVSYQKIMPSGPNIPEVEYHLVRSVRELAEKGDRIAVGTWDRGYFTEAVSGLDCLTSPAYIDKELNEFFWQPEEIAAVNFNRKKARYIVISERDFKLVKVDEDKNEFRCSHAGGFVMPSPRPSFILFRKLVLYQMLYDEEKLRFFVKIRETNEPRSGDLIRLYRTEEVFPGEQDVFLSSRVLKNSGYQVTFSITARLKNKNTGEVREQNRTVEFAPDEMKVVTFNHTPVANPEDWEVTYGYVPLYGYIKGRYRNSGARRTATIRYALKDVETGKEDESVEETVEFTENETRTVVTRVDFKRPDRQYQVLLETDAGLERLSLKAIKPELNVLFKGTGYRE